MAEAGPSTSPRPVSPPITPPSSPQQRVARIHFPVECAPANDNGPHGDVHSLGLGPPPSLRKSLNQTGSLSFQDDKRRRVRSVDASNGFDQTRAWDARQGSSPRRTASFSRGAEHRKSIIKGIATAIPETFSDEFDLSREDPGVLEDVQRALRLKARREARHKAHPTPLHVEAPNDATSLSSVSAGSLPVQVAIPPLFPRQPRVSGDSEIDFSPSIGVMPLHPVPTSSDGGATLDWTTPMTDDGRERRWSLSRGKRKSKEQTSFSANKTAAEKQEALYASKLEQIRATVQSQTHRKAEIVRDQLARKYALLVPKGQSPPAVNILEVARWYNKQDFKVRTSLDQTERVTWMKHIWEKHTTPPGGHSMWSPTALVMEEYVKSQSSPHTMDTIPENEVILPASPHTSLVSDTRSPTTSSWTTPRDSLEAAISRKRYSYDVPVSFGPHTESGRDSGGLDSRRSSDNYKNGKNGVDSGQSSLYSILSRGASPNGSRRRLRDFGRRLTPRVSDEVLSSARNSISDNSGHSASEDGVRPGHQKIATFRPHSRPASLHLHASPPLTLNPNPSANDAAQSDTPDVLTTATQSSTIFPTPAEPTPRPEVAQAHSKVPTTLPRRRHRRSLPSSNDIFARARERHQRSADEHKEREEYEVKAQVLGDTLSQNYRMRHLLQRVCASIREYDSMQASLSVILGIPHSKIPHEVLDAFLHDPSAITGKTRRAQGWRAAEDIYHRIQKQQETLQAYRRSLLDSGSITPPHKVFEDPVASLMQALDKLAAQREHLALKAEDVSTVLKHVKGIQADVKKQYNDTLAHTSLVYPELSQIAALDENIRNRYQQFWDIGLNALTFILDTVTPFWRNYGKVIGEDIQDFLIIPLYRNEFTGEPKRYLIEQFPRRSPRHWVGLVFLSFLSFSVAILQMRAAWSLTVHINLPWISHMGLRWIIIPVYVILLLIQWCAVLVELCILAAQAGVIVWWIGWFVKLVS